MPKAKLIQSPWNKGKAVGQKAPFTPEQVRSAYQSQIPLGRFGTAEDVAAAVVFLSGDRAGYLTGQTLHVNGGLYMG